MSLIEEARALAAMRRRVGSDFQAPDLIDALADALESTAGYEDRIAELEATIVRQQNEIAVLRANVEPASHYPYEQMNWDEQWHIDQLNETETKRLARMKELGPGEDMRDVTYLRLRMDDFYHRWMWTHTQIDRYVKEKADRKYKHICSEYGRASKTIHELRETITAVGSRLRTIASALSEQSTDECDHYHANLDLLDTVEALERGTGMHEVTSAEELDALPVGAIVHEIPPTERPAVHTWFKHNGKGGPTGSGEWHCACDGTSVTWSAAEIIEDSIEAVPGTRLRVLWVDEEVNG